MSKILGLNGHIAFSHYHRIEKVCNTLFRQAPIQFFSYSRFFSDGGQTFLASHTDLGSYFFKDGAYLNSWIFNTPFENFKSGLLLWDVARNFNSPKQYEIDQLIKKQFKLIHGIDIMEKSVAHSDSYCFASNNRDIYHCSTNYLKQFIFFFRQECHELIKQAHAEKLYSPSICNDKKIVPIIQDSSRLDQINTNMFGVKKFYLQGEQDGIYLTKKEVEYLKQLAKGNTAKEAARELQVSYRTIEHHIEHIKIKLHCNHLSEILLMAMRNNLID